MKQALTANNTRGRALIQTAMSLVVGVALAGAFWVASTPVANGVQKTPAETIQTHLPKDMTIASASDRQLLDAVCKAVRQSPKEAALIVRTAGGARQNIRADVLCMAIKCSRAHSEDVHGAQCTWVIEVVREWIKQDPSLASQVTESISQCSPECRDTLQAAIVEGKDIPAEGPGGGEFSGPVLNNLNPPPGSVGSGGGPGGNACIVCHNNQNVTIACTDVQTYLQSHSGDTAGACQATPVANP